MDTDSWGEWVERKVPSPIEPEAQAWSPRVNTYSPIPQSTSNSSPTSKVDVGKGKGVVGGNSGKERSSDEKKLQATSTPAKAVTGKSQVQNILH